MKLSSPDLGHNGNIPSECTCDGINISPELALVMDDPDAIPVAGHAWDHWVVWNMPPDTHLIQKGKEPKGTQGTTSFKRTGYGGPCPPNGLHKYFFKLYALDKILDIPEKSNKEQLERAMEGHIIEKTELVGNYNRVKG
jgi:Raf kinase inhibitor-like YbhB/YbcL family protein